MDAKITPFGGQYCRANYTDKLVTDDLRSYGPAAGHLESQSVMNAVDGATISGEFASADPTTRTQDARFRVRGQPKISLNARSRLQHFQRPAPSHLSKNAPSLQGHGDADVARSRRCGVSLTCQQICYVLYLVT